MSVIKFRIRSVGDNATIYVRFALGRSVDLEKKTGYLIKAKDWSKDRKKQGIILRNEELKALQVKLDRMAVFLREACNNDTAQGIELNADWLQKQIDLFHNKKPIAQKDLLTNYISRYIAEAPYKLNAKRELGLSEGRVRNLKLFQNTILKYEAEALNGKSIVIKDVNVKFADNFKKWLFDKNYSANYVGKNISNLRAVCTDAGKNEIEVSPQLNHIKFLSESKAPEDIVYLNEEELEAIRKVPLTRESLINARKWLLLGCLLGQRGGDLLSITDQNIKNINGIKIIELRQGKTGKIVAIPLLPEAAEIVEQGMPYKISMVHFNEYIKEVCEAAKISTPIKGRQKLKNGVATKKDIFPKWKVVSSHVCRRSFASNFYGKIPTPILMSITGHGTESMFLKYIGKTSYDNAHQMLEYFSRLTPVS